MSAPDEQPAEQPRDDAAAPEDAPAYADEAPAGESPFPEPTLLRHVFDLAQQVAMALGEVENPITKKREKNLHAARYLIDTIDLLERKTRGNRDEEEDGYLTGVLSNLKMAYVNRSK